MTAQSEAYVGIDVGKTWLDVAVWDREGMQRVSNEDSGIGEILDWVAELEPQLIVVEATEGYEQRLVQAMLRQGLPVAVANPTRAASAAYLADAKKSAGYCIWLACQPSDATPSCGRFTNV